MPTLDLDACLLHSQRVGGKGRGISKGKKNGQGKSAKSAKGVKKGGKSKTAKQVGKGKSAKQGGKGKSAKKGGKSKSGKKGKGKSGKKGKGNSGKKGGKSKSGKSGNSKVSSHWCHPSCLNCVVDDHHLFALFIPFSEGGRHDCGAQGDHRGTETDEIACAATTDPRLANQWPHQGFHSFVDLLQHNAARQYFFLFFLSLMFTLKNPIAEVARCCGCAGHRLGHGACRAQEENNRCVS